MNYFSKIAVTLLFLSLSASFAVRIKKTNRHCFFSCFTQNANQLERNTNARGIHAPQAHDLRRITRQARIAAQQNAPIMNVPAAQYNALHLQTMVRIEALPLPINAEQRAHLPTLDLTQAEEAIEDAEELSTDNIIANMIDAFTSFNRVTAIPDITEQARTYATNQMRLYVDQTINQISYDNRFIDAVINNEQLHESNIQLIVDVLLDRQERGINRLNISLDDNNSAEIGMNNRSVV